MSNIIVFNNFSKNTNTQNTNSIIWEDFHTNQSDYLAFSPEIIEFTHTINNKARDIYMLWIPDLADLNKFEKLKERVWKIEWYEYLRDFILNTVKKNYEMKPNIIPFFIKTNLDKCSESDIKEVVWLINTEIKRLKMPTKTKEFLLNIRNLCIAKNKQS